MGQKATLLSYPELAFWTPMSGLPWGASKLQRGPLSSPESGGTTQT